MKLSIRVGISSFLFLLIVSGSFSICFAEGATVKVGDTIQPFMLPIYGQTGKYIALRDYCGEPRPTRPREKRRIVVMSFFAHYCEPCRREIPRLEALSKKWGDSVETFLIAVGDKTDVVKEWLEGTPTSLPVLMDPYASTATDRYGVTAMPTIFVVDPQGVVQYTHTGYKDGDELEVDRVVKKLLGGGSEGE